MRKEQRILYLKLEIAQKECYETEYWMELLFETVYIPENICKSLQNQCGQIRRIKIILSRKWLI